MSRISLRLQTIASLADADVIADIGCDHAYACCLAVKQGRAKKAYACDLRPGPLDNAARTIAEYGLQEQVFCRLQNGVEGLPEDVQQLIIAGIGGTLIAEILEKLDENSQVSTLLLSPHKDAPTLRHWLAEHGYAIEWEKWLKEGHYYPILKVRRHASMQLSEEEALYGKNPVCDLPYRQMLQASQAKWSRIAESAPKALAPEFEHRAGLAARLLAEME